MPRNHPYVERLRAVRDEFESVRQGMAYLSRNWQKHNMALEMPDLEPIHLARARDFLLATYLLRLSAEFEGILKYHLSEHHAISIPKDAKVDWLMSQARKAEKIALDKNLQTNLERIRAYRNEFVHSGNSPSTTLAFESVLSWYSTFVSKLPA